MKFLSSYKASPIQELHDPLFEKHQVKVFLKRDDQVHPELSGNKYRKLKYNLIDAHERGFKTLLSYGGAFSNHIHALATAASLGGFKSIGIIRGDELETLNPTLQYAKTKGMHLHYLSRSEYKQKDEAHAIEKLEKQFGQFYRIPEGGTNKLALIGCSEIVQEIKEQIGEDYHYLVCPLGTAGTAAGLLNGLSSDKKLIMIPVLKAETSHKRSIQEFCPNNKQNWLYDKDFHFGGYARFNTSLVNFINAFNQKHTIQLDPIYTGKMMFALYKKISAGFFKKGEKIIALHTGGLQGNIGFNQRFGNLLKNEI